MIKVHPVCQAMLDELAAAPPPEPGGDIIATIRASAEERSSDRSIDRAEMDKVENLSVTVRDGFEVPVRIYTPKTAESGGPVIVYYHGGAWVSGSLDTHDNTCRAMAATSGYKLIAVEYRLAPEHKFPVGLNDCCDVTEWVAAMAKSLEVDASRLIIAGDSAGSNLAAAVALWARDYDGPKIAFQFLIYPVIDSVLVSGSRKDFGEGYFLTQAAMNWTTGQYVAEEAQRSMWQVSPIYAETLAGLPPAHIVTAGFDILKDEGIAYARALHGAGVAATHVDYPDVIHGFIGFGSALEPAVEAMARGCAEMRKVVGA
jgi:acetyl esterase